jgi:hypothetical protein
LGQFTGSGVINMESEFIASLGEDLDQ